MYDSTHNLLLYFKGKVITLTYLLFGFQMQKLMVVITPLFKMFKQECILSIVKLLLIFKTLHPLGYIWNQHSDKLITSFPFFCLMQQVWYWRATIILIILTSFAEVAAATVIIHIVKRKKMCKSSACQC